MQDGETRRILIVEDEEIVAMIVTEMLADAGYVTIGPVATVADALALIEAEAERIDAALLDVNLRGQSSYPVADALRSRGIGFAFTTGFGDGSLPENYRRMPCCAKPFSEASLLTAVQKLFTKEPLF